MVRSGRSVDQESIGRSRGGQEGRTVAASGGSVLGSEGVDIMGRHRGVVDRKGVVVLGLLGTADIRIFI